MFVNGDMRDEPDIEPDDLCAICNLPGEVTIPDDHYFLMGDNRGESADSREWGPVPRDWIRGEVRLRYWPLGRLGSP